MKLKEMREFLNGLPEHLDECEVEYREVARIMDGRLYLKDTPIDIAQISDDEKELNLMTSETDDKMKNYFEENNDGE